MQIELHIPSGLLLAVDGAWSRGTNFFVGRLGNGGTRTYNTNTCIPHDTLCGAFSRSERIATQDTLLSNATSRSGVDFWAAQYMKRYGVIKP